MLTQERLKELLHYNSETGEFTWLVARNGTKNDHTAGSADSQGYVGIRIDGRRHKAHRLAWLYVHGRWPESFIDHINQVRKDNRISNLREATRSLNGHNRPKPKHNTSGFKGVSFHRKTGKWKASVTFKGVRHYLGLFASPREAHQAYKTKIHSLAGDSYGI